MSGIAGIVRFDGRTVSAREVGQLTDRMIHRGPDGIGLFHNAGVALGHCLTRTTEEAADEHQPLANDDGSIVLVFDGWLQNWTDLRKRLLGEGLRLRTRADSELVLRAYERWSYDCVDHLHGDFAFALWNDRTRELFCARDRIGMRPFHYHRSRTGGFFFASDEEALLGHPDVPRRLDQGRIADAIVGELEAFDLSGTFHSDISRLPPAHTLIATSERLLVSRYWQHEPKPMLRLTSPGSYREQFREVLDEAVSCRMRGRATTVFMVSGGLDSSSSAALARLRSQADGHHIRTVSAVGIDRVDCIETRCARTFGKMSGVDARFAALDDLAPLMPDLIKLSLSPLSPFDQHNALLRSVYLTARQSGARAVVDGVGGDLVLSDGGYLPYLLQNGRFTTACREANAASRFWGRGARAHQRLYRAAKDAFIPAWSRAWLRKVNRSNDGTNKSWADALIDPSFATAVQLDERLTQGRQRAVHPPGSTARRAQTVFHMHNVAARERYEREAARIGIEPRDPYFDVRVIEFCLSLPVELLVSRGWTKFILRDAMVDRLPDEIRWRKGRAHLGWKYSRSVIAASRQALLQSFERDFAAIKDFVRADKVRQLCSDFQHGATLSKHQEADFYKTVLLARFVAARS